MFSSTKFRETHSPAVPPEKERDASVSTKHGLLKSKKKPKLKDAFSLSAKKTSYARQKVRSDLFSLSAPLKEIRRPLEKQRGEASELLLRSARKSFEKNVPYIFSYQKYEKFNIVFDVSGLMRKKFGSLEQEQQFNLENSVWRQHFSSSTFFAFLDERSPAIKIGTIKYLERRGLGNEVILWNLLAPFGWPEEKSQVLYMFLSEQNVLDKKFKKYELSVRQRLDEENIKWQKEDLLIDFAGTDSSKHLRTLLDQGVNPNAFSDLVGIYAIHAAIGNKREDNVRILIEYGADPKAKVEDPSV